MKRRKGFSDLFFGGSFRDVWRSMRNVFVERKLPAAGPMPCAGSYIARDDVRVVVTEEITEELWVWLTERDWREIDLATDRRRYRAGMPSAIEELSFAESDAQRTHIEHHIRRTARMSAMEMQRKPNPPRRVA